MISNTTHSQLIVAGFGRCTGPRLLWVISKILKCYGQRGSPFIYDELMLGCEEKNLGRGYLLPNSFPTRHTYIYVLLKTLCYHIPSIRNGDAAHAAIHTDAALAAIQTDAALAAVQTDAAPAAVQTDTAPAAVQTNAAPAAVQTDAMLAAVQTDAAPAAVQTDVVLAAVQTDGGHAAVPTVTFTPQHRGSFLLTAILHAYNDRHIHNVHRIVAAFAI